MALHSYEQPHSESHPLRRTRRGAGHRPLRVHRLPASSPPQYYIIREGPGVADPSCLDAVDGKRGRHVTINGCNAQPNQDWRFTLNGTTAAEPEDFRVLEIRSWRTDFCLDVNHASHDPGAVIQLWGCNGDLNQKWHLIPTPIKGEYQLRSAESGMCMTRSNGSSPAVVQDNCVSGAREARQTWRFTPSWRGTGHGHGHHHHAESGAHRPPAPPASWGLT